VAFNARLLEQLAKAELGQGGDFSRRQGRDRTLHVVTLGVVETESRLEGGE
jgi:hypothetical protein